MNNVLQEDLIIVYEGQTEEQFLKKLKKIYKEKVKIHLKNAHGKDKIIDKYFSTKKNNPYSEVIVMYDLDNTTSIKDILKIYKKRRIGINKNNIYFISSEFELIFVLCKQNRYPLDKYEEEMLNLYEIEEYDKEEKQVKKIIDQISKDEIEVMIKRITKMSDNDNESRSTNYDKLIRRMFYIED